MKHMILFLLPILMLSGCDSFNEINTGLAQGKHDCSMWEYFRKDKTNWDSVMIAIDHAGIRNIFDGTHPDYREGITFFGMTNYSIKLFIMHSRTPDWKPKYQGIRDIPTDICRKMILSHVIKGKKTSTDFEFEVKGTLTGGSLITSLSGTQLRIYRIKNPYHQTPDAGPEFLAIHALESGQMANVASSNIETTTGIVHALSYEYEWTEL